ncbi:Increased rDNA silencing protein [Curvularia kusanoi]|uniref:Increased rDNA silencing protein n=1 Tax=Curvularia kusanoi TaxID=90978 RepID=A0A9P4TMN4_CURKU|nr:Increased rDNA silencing protein [Curvularia kusanoi]
MSSSVRSRNVAPQSTGDTQHNVRDAALIGASSAFAKPPAKPQHLTNTYTGGSNGALLAATKVGTGRPSSSAGSVQRDYTGGSSRGVSRPHPSPKHVSSSSSLGVPDTHSDRAPSPSPSYTAAKLAAARLSPLRPAAPPKASTMASERDADERDVLPPSGSVGNVLARLEQQRPGRQQKSQAQRPQSSRDVVAPQQVAHAAATESRDRPTDDTPIPPTNSLVKMFEQQRPATPAQPPVISAVDARKSPPPLKSPKPRRNFSFTPEVNDDAPLTRKKTNTPPPVPKSKPSVEVPRPQFVDGAQESSRPLFAQPQPAPLKSPPIKQKPIQLAAINTRALPSPTSSGQIRPKSQDSKRSATFHRRLSTSLESNAPSSPAVSFKSAKEDQEEDEKAKATKSSSLEEEEKAKPALPPPRRSNTRKSESVPADSKLLKPSLPPPRKQGKSASPLHPADRLHPPERLSPPRRPSSATGGSVYHNPYQRESVKAITKHMTGESLSSAIMGAALASSRTSSPAPPPQNTLEPLFPSRKGHSHHHHHMPFHRSPSPQKGSPPKATGKLRTTMRKEPSPASSSEDEFEFKGKGNRMLGMKVRKHPNKHHEGQRKRWRDQITERERKRYEGVWAANKGIFLPAAKQPSAYTAEEDPSLDVLNLVVKEIWMRSRLPEHVLEEVWALVDGREIGRLTRVEFVVGLWLVDQRLKGRKLPTRVSDSVWSSARGLGIKVKVRG